MTSPPDDDVQAMVARYLPSLRAFVRLRMGAELRAREESCDIVQSVAREVLQNADRFRYGGEVGFREWLFTTAHRKVVDHLVYFRAQKRNPARETPMPAELADLVPTPSQNASHREQFAAVEQAFERLTEEQREVVTCARLLGMSHAEIAARLGKSAVAVRKTLSRGMARLAALLVGEADQPDGPG